MDHTAPFDQLRKFDTPTICNCIELFDVRPRNSGYMDHRIRACFPQMAPMVGFACTAAFRSGAPPAGGDAYGGFLEQGKMDDGLPANCVRVAAGHPATAALGPAFGPISAAAAAAEERKAV